MNKYIFLYKDNTEDRDCCAYIEANAERFECGHYFGSVTLHGACYCGGTFANYEDIKTILTKYEEAYSCGYIKDNDITSRYFDFEAFGEDLADDDYRCELPDGRIVSLMY